MYLAFAMFVGSSLFIGLDLLLPIRICNTLQHVDHSGGVTAIASKDFMRFGETIPVEHQPYNYLFAVGSGVARTAAPI